MDLGFQIIAYAFGILSIIMFFKVWGMTNDVRALKEHFLGDDKEERLERTESAVCQARVGEVKPGYLVKLKSTGKVGVMSSMDMIHGSCSVRLKDGKSVVVNMSDVEPASVDEQE